MGRTIIATITKSQISHYKLPSGKKPGTPQSMCTISNNNHVVIHNQSNANNVGWLKRYNNSGAYTTSSDNNLRKSTAIGHGNGCCYIAPLGLIGVKQSSNSVVSLYDCVTLQYKRKVNLKSSTSNIAFDKITNQIVTRSGSYMYVYPVTYISGSSKKYAKVKISGFNSDSVQQDIGAYNGITYILRTPGKKTSYIDTYNTGTGKYLGSYHIPYLKELESVDFYQGKMFGIGATNRRFCVFNYNFVKQGSAASISKDTTSNATTTVAQASSAVASSSSYTTDEKTARNALISKYGNEAEVYFALRDAGYSHVGTCAIMGNIAQESGFRINAVSYDGMGSYGICQWTNSRKTNLKKWCSSNGYKSNTIKGQVAFLIHELSSYDTLNADLKAGTKSVSALTEEFETKFERAGVPRMENRISKATTYVTRYKAFAGSKFTGMSLDGSDVAYGTGLAVSVDKLISSENYIWCSDAEKEEVQQDIYDSVFSKISESASEAIAKMTSASSVVNNLADIIAQLANIKESIREKSVVSGEASGDKLPLSHTLVEAPWFGVIIGGRMIGTHDKGVAPNYINSFRVEKVNGRVCKYEISLIHQVEAGDNPNYIDELLGINGFNKITIMYGDQTTYSFLEDDAILTQVTQSFDFSSSLISYTLYATSNQIKESSAKYRFGKVTAKPSDVIRDMLWGNPNSSLLESFPGMADKALVESHNLIPTDDTEIELEDVESTTSLDYLSSLVSAMIPNTSTLNGDINDAIYLLTYCTQDDTFDSDYFRITKINTNQTDIKSSQYYEVNVGFDSGDEYVYDFNIGTNYAWALNYSGGAVDTNVYNYAMDSQGGIIKASGVSNTQWWTQVSGFPVTAQLSVRGLLVPLPLMTYIKVNNLYYGNKRVTSGVYAVIGQTDTLDGSGFKTSLSLLKVAADTQHVITDARVRT